MTKVFVSYRREDSMAITGRLCDRLRAKFGRDNVYVDIDNIPYGTDFVDSIEATLKQCDFVLVVIGKQWRGKRTKGKCRLEEVNDFVRMELRIAFSQSMQILPILVRGAQMPSWEELPEEIRHLSRPNAAPLDIGRDFDRDTDKILLVIGEMAKMVAFSMSYGSSDIGYRCRRCGYEAWIHKLEWQRDDERPPAKCPRCGGKGYSE
jgi:DNA-directed RNA polymerase subunit RPC12/RpoP